MRLRTQINHQRAAGLCALLGLACGCSPVSPDVPAENQNTSDPVSNTNANDNSSVVETDPRQPSFVFIKNAQDVDIEALAAEAFDWVIIDTSRSGSEEDEFAPTEVRSIKEGRPSCSERRTLAYLNIGQAQSQRSWFDVVWITGAAGFIGYPTPGVAPEWLGDWDFELPGTYEVRFWDEQWQAIIAGDPQGPDDSPVDRILDAGFDGMCLDGVASFDYWSDRPFGSELSRAEGREVMIEWVRDLAAYAREVRGSEFLIFVQNGLDIVLDSDGAVDALGEGYLDFIDGVVVENLYSEDARPRAASKIDEDLAILAAFENRAIKVLVVDYIVVTASFSGLSEPLVEELYARSLASGYVPYAADTDLSLSEPVVLDATVWPVTQPPPCEPSELTDSE